MGNRHTLNTPPPHELRLARRFSLSPAKTPLFRLASRRSRVATQEEQIATAARLLLDRGANLPRSARGTTALIEAVQNRHHAMAAVLIDSGQRLDSANSYGDNALHILCRRAAEKGMTHYEISNFALPSLR